MTKDKLEKALLWSVNYLSRQPLFRDENVRKHGAMREYATDSAMDIYERTLGRSKKDGARLNTEWMANLVKQASENADIDLALRELREEMLKRDEAIPPPQEYFREHVVPPESNQKRGPNPIHRNARNAAIVRAIGFLQREYGIPPTRNRAKTGEECGCSIVAAALEVLNAKVSEEAIEQILTRHRRPCPTN